MTIIRLERLHEPLGRAGALAVAIGAASALRALTNGRSVPSAFAAGAAFGVILLLLTLAAGWRFIRPPARSLVAGLGGGAVLLAVPILLHPETADIVGMRPEPFWGWAAVTILVACAEEVAFRGSLLDVLAQAAGWEVAIALSSLAFALIHVPLYGWGVIPLDFAAGVWLAGLRLISGSVAAPAVAHVVADLATWWL